MSSGKILCVSKALLKDVDRKWASLIIKYSFHYNIW